MHPALAALHSPSPSNGPLPELPQPPTYTCAACGKSKVCNTSRLFGTKTCAKATTVDQTPLREQFNLITKV